MTKDEINKKSEEIEKIYADYVAEMNKLKKEQDELLDNFLQELEKAKIEELKANLK
ncbi:MAG: hypothetical protein WCK16_04435 [Candidatus Moraniibacteriota bacterium]|jgi:hypothetical protein